MSDELDVMTLRKELVLSRKARRELLQALKEERETNAKLREIIRSLEVKYGEA